MRYEYDALGRRVCEAPVPTLLNGLMERAGVDQPAIPQRKQYTYNAQGQLASVHIPDTETTVTFTYDPLGRRNSKTFTDSKGQPTTTRYLWDGDLLLATWVEGSPAGATTCISYIFEPGSFAPLAEVITPYGQEHKAAELDHELERAQVEADSFVNPEHPFGCETQTRFYHTNHLSAPEEITNEQGELIWRGRYSAYGNVLIEEGEETQPFRFAGQFADPETGLYYNRHRYYDADTASFISQDPIGLLGGLNPYRYVPNPVGWADPLGLSCKEGDSFNSTNGVPLSQAKIEEIQAIPKGHRPDPSEYLPQSYIDAHLQEFVGGASFIIPKEALDHWGRDPVGRIDGQFLLSKTQMDEMLERTGGDLIQIERELGIPPGSWSNQEMVVIDIPNVKKQNIRIPTGNESGANNLWIPGGKLPTGHLEAVLDAIPRGEYIESTLVNLR